jgi:hypothetical protein
MGPREADAEDEHGIESMLGGRCRMPRWSQSFPNKVLTKHPLSTRRVHPCTVGESRKHSAVRLCATCASQVELNPRPHFEELGSTTHADTKLGNRYDGERACAGDLQSLKHRPFGLDTQLGR